MRTFYCGRRGVISTVVAALLVSFGSGTVAAQSDRPNWTGIAIYGGIGVGRFGDVDVSDTTTYRLRAFQRDFSSAPTNNFSFGSDGSSFFGTVGVGADFEPTSRVVFGAFADADFYNSDSDFSGSSSANIFRFGPLRLSSRTNVAGNVEYDYSYTLGARLGLLSSDRKSLMYLLVGWTHLEAGGQAQIDNTFRLRIGPAGINVPIAAGRVDLPGSFDGLTLGAGVEAKLDQSWSLKFEGRYTNFGSKTVNYAFPGVAGNFLGARYSASSAGSITVDPDLISVRALLSYKFN